MPTEPTPDRFRVVGAELVAEFARMTGWRVRIEAPDGSMFERDVLRNQQVVAVVPVHHDGTVTLVSQYRAAIDSELLELPAGLCDVVGEEPEVTAGRELLEETGLTATRLHPLAGWWANAGFSDQYVRLYLATGLVEGDAAPEGPEEEAMTRHRFPLADVHEAIADGRIADAKTLIGLLLAEAEIRRTDSLRPDGSGRS